MGTWPQIVWILGFQHFYKGYEQKQILSDFMKHVTVFQCATQMDISLFAGKDDAEGEFCDHRL